MSAPLNRKELVKYGIPALSGFLALLLLVVTGLVMAGKPAKIKRLHREIGTLQERLISAEITSNRLKHVQGLIDNNTAFSLRDSLAQGASLGFLRDLTQVLDLLKITLVSLTPEEPADRASCVETPYRMEVLCSYPQFLQLLNKMEKSPRLISLSDFEIRNNVEDYFSDDREALEQCRVTLRLTTLNLIRSRP